MVTRYRVLNNMLLAAFCLYARRIYSHMIAHMCNNEVGTRQSLALTNCKLVLGAVASTSPLHIPCSWKPRRDSRLRLGR